jgi:hypothetical protein
MNESSYIVNGEEFIQFQELCYGDYDNSSDIERANHREISEKYSEAPIISFSSFRENLYTGATEYSSFDDNGDATGEESSLKDDEIILTRGAFGGHGVLVRKYDSDGDEPELYKEISESLANYPLYASDETLIKVQKELKDEAFEDFGEHDLRKIIEKSPSDFGIKTKDEDWEVSDHPLDNKLKDLWDTITNHESIQGVFESSGYYIDLDKDEVKKEIKDFVEEIDTPKKNNSKSFRMK